MLLVGIVRRPHGTSGELSVEPATDFPERFAAGARFLWRREEDQRSLSVVTARPHGARILIRFEGVDGAAAARSLAGGELWVPEEEAIPPPEDFYYGHEVEGWRCEDPEGRVLGTARRLTQTAGGPMLDVDTGRAELVSVPFVRPIVVSVERTEKRIVLDPPEGLMELSS
jgi:16S rRNA processing protein RimM